MIKYIGANRPMTTIQILGFIGILLVIGFIGDFLFRKISLPDILILLGLGYVIGPVLNIVEPSQIAPASQIIATLSLAVILFNGGLDLNISQVLANAPRTIALVVLGIGASGAAVAATAYYLFDWDAMSSILLGAILSGTSPSIVMPLISRAKVPGKISSLLSLESVFDGALVIIIALVILETMTGGNVGNGATAALQAVAVKFSIGLGIGVAAGFLWLWILSLIEGETFDDILTLAIVFVAYFGVESINGSGAIFALVFGLILGNGVYLGHFLRIKRTGEIHDMMKKFHAQVSFLIKTFFFVYLGTMMTFDNPDFIAMGGILALALLLARYVAVLLSSIGSRTLLKNSGVLATMLPRGLSAAVVAEMVVAAGVANASSYPKIIMVVIVATVVISALGILLFASKPPAQEPGQSGNHNGGLPAGPTCPLDRPYEADRKTGLTGS
jgi:cell volume regulation protein A